MSAMVRLGPGKTGGPLGITSEGLDYVILTPNMRSVRLPAGELEKLSGRDDLDGSVVPANVRVLIKTPTPLQPRRYETIVSYNPELLRYGTVSCPTLVGPGQGDSIVLRLHADKKVDLADFEYVFELSMID